MLIWLTNVGHLPALIAGHAEAWQKITLRASSAAMVSFLLAVWLGPRLIRWLRARFREPIVSDSARIEQLHRHKQWTPTMGGLFIVAGVTAAILLFGDLTNAYVLAALALTIGFAALGSYDDLQKLARGRGIRASTKLVIQTVIAIGIAFLLYNSQSKLPGGVDLAIPLTGTTLSLGAWFVPLAVLVIVGSSNAVNVTDGLDGLACGCLIFTAAAMGAAAYVAGHAELAKYLNVLRVPGAGELTVVVGAMIGAVLGFLWFNCHPAQVFMGDTGSLPLGGLLGLVAVVARQEFLLLIVAGVFVAEAASVVLQVGWYKLRRQRIFLCAPLHHHFQFLGWSENKIVVRFWIASALFAILGLAGLKGTGSDSPRFDRSDQGPPGTAVRSLSAAD